MSDSGSYSRPLVYAGMSGDLVHPGHVSVIREAWKHTGDHGSFVIGLVTDKGVARFKRLPAMPWEYRKAILETMQGVTDVVPQHSPDYRENLERYRPDVVIHGDDWVQGQPAVRQRVIDTVQQWGGYVVDVPRPEGSMSSSDIHKYLRTSVGTTTETRRQRLARLLGAKDVVRLLEVHSGLGAKIVEDVSETVDYDGGIDTLSRTEEFDGVSLSSLSTSLASGSPFLNDYVAMPLIDQILDATTKPVVVDNGNGGSNESFGYGVRRLERLGVSATILSGLAEGYSRFDGSSATHQESIQRVAERVSAGKKAQVTSEFMVFAKIHSLHIEGGLDDALERARAYLDSGIDGIMVPQLDPSLPDVTRFFDRYSQFTLGVPIIASPDLDQIVRERELIDLGVRMVVYEDRLVRSVDSSMEGVVREILRSKGNAGSKK